MFKNLNQIYCLTVCLIASVIMMITIGIILTSGTDLILTEYKHMSQLSKFTSDEKYTDYQKQIDSSDKEKWQTLSKDLIKNKRIAAREDYISEIKGNAISSIITGTAWLITCLFFFISHWKMYRCCASNTSLN